MRLKEDDCYVTKSHEERLHIVEMFHRVGVKVSDVTYRHRNIKDVSECYPTLIWHDNQLDGLGATDEVGLRNQNKNPT